MPQYLALGDIDLFHILMLGIRHIQNSCIFSRTSKVPLSTLFYFFLRGSRLGVAVIVMQIN